MPSDGRTVSQQVVSGSTAACAELIVGHPLWTIKTRVQNKQNFTLNPRILYRGIQLNAASMMPITSSQMVLSHLFKSVFFLDKNNVVSQQHVNLAGAFFGGAVAAVFACPAEMVMIHMKAGQGFVPTAQALIKQDGIKRLYAGAVMTAIRDGCFGVGYMALPGFLEKKFNPYFEKNHAAWLSKVVAGISSAVISQAFDTLKTVQQTAGHGVGVFNAVKKPYAEHGFLGYFKGGLARGTRVAGAVCIMSKVNENMSMFFNQREEERIEHTLDRSITSPKNPA